MTEQERQSAWPRGWPPFAQRPLSRRRAAAAALILGALPALVLGGSAEKVWMRLTWPSAEAVIIAPPRVGPPAEKRGATYWPVFEAHLPDGRIVRGEAERPLFAESVEPATPNRPWRRPPQAGDRLTVRLAPSDPSRMVPERELRMSPFIIFETMWAATLSWLLYLYLRGAPLQLAFDLGRYARWRDTRGRR